MWLITFIAAAFLSAVMDTVENENFGQSDLKNFNEKWWYKRESWKTARKVFGWKFDAWHLAKSLMIVLLTASILLYHFAAWWRLGVAWQDMLKDFVIAGAAWNLVFNVSYKLLKT